MPPSNTYLTPTLVVRCATVDEQPKYFLTGTRGSPQAPTQYSVVPVHTHVLPPNLILPLSYLWPKPTELLAVGKFSHRNNALSTRGRVVNGLSVKPCRM